MIPVVRSKLFASYPSLVLGVSTRQGGVSPDPLGMNLSFNVGDEPGNVRRNRSLFFEALGISEGEVVTAGQVHSAVVSRAEAAGRIPDCDALATDRSGLFLAVSIADCIPVVLYDPQRECVAAVHAGWRGSASRIAGAAVRRLAEWFSAEPGNLRAWIGPGAGVCCYEVGEEVGEQFPAHYLDRSRSSKAHLDLKSFNRDVLKGEGVPHDQIDVSDACTICGVDKFHSYRRDGARSGRMLAVIGIRRNQ